MGDALCGPSNALQSFQKHTAVDRTLQQDRLTARHSPSQGFRSSPGPSAGLLDPEFEAFQSGQLPLPHPDAQQFHPSAFPPSYVPQQLNQAASNAWASDFQNLNIASPAPQPRQHNYGPQSQPQQLGNGWQDEFAKRQNQSVGSVRPDHPGYSSIPFQRLSTIAPMAPMQASSYTIPASQGQLDQPQAQSTEAFDEEAFARAFEKAAQGELAREQVTQQQALDVDQNVLVNESAERLMSSDQLPETQRIGADLIHDPREGGSEQQQRQGDPDALARTAGQLLDSVRDDHSAKFQQSQFLQLMRQLRDREVTVEGDKIVGVQSEDSKSNGNQGLEKSLLSGIARQLSLLDFARVEPILLVSQSTSLSSSSHKPPLSHPSFQDRLLLGAFTLSLLYISSALTHLLTHRPTLPNTATPLGLHIGVEVFALSRPPFSLLLNSYSAFQNLKVLVASFRQQFEELGIRGEMVRRAGEGEREELRGNAAEGETELRQWLDEWLGSVNARRQTQGQGQGQPWRLIYDGDGGGGDSTTTAVATTTTVVDDSEWVFSPSQIRALLGAEVYRFPPTDSTETAPTQEHLDLIRAILGEDILGALVRIWKSGHTRVFVNAVVGDVQALEGFVESASEGEGKEDEEMGKEKWEREVRLEEVFPLSRGSRFGRGGGTYGPNDWVADLEERWELLRGGRTRETDRRGGAWVHDSIYDGQGVTADEQE